MVAEAQIESVLLVEEVGRTWRAFTTKVDGEWRLYIENDGVPVLAGAYENGRAVAKLARRYMREKFGPYVTPKLDTFDRMVGRDVNSVVPSCYRQPETQDDKTKCARCPYGGKCAAPVPNIFEDYEPEEPEEVLMARLRKKVAAVWGEES